MCYDPMLHNNKTLIRVYTWVEAPGTTQGHLAPVQGEQKGRVAQGQAPGMGARVWRSCFGKYFSLQHCPMQAITVETRGNCQQAWSRQGATGWQPTGGSGCSQQAPSPLFPPPLSKSCAPGLLTGKTVLKSAESGKGFTLMTLGVSSPPAHHQPSPLTQDRHK